MQIVSVNVGMPRPLQLGDDAVMSGIVKTPVNGAVAVTADGLRGDGQADLSVHGGEWKAVYAYPAAHYPYWRHRLDREDLAFGYFGENLTIDGVGEDICIGDQLRIGEVVLQVTQPRQPCFKLGIRMGDSSFPKEFLESGRTGFYLRVVHAGTVEQGDSVEVIARDVQAVSIRDVWRTRFVDRDDVAACRRIAAVDTLESGWRKWFQEQADR
jgi:MOSC domain-containing protein YiiM